MSIKNVLGTSVSMLAVLAVSAPAFAQTKIAIGRLQIPR